MINKWNRQQHLFVLICWFSLSLPFCILPIVIRIFGVEILENFLHYLNRILLWHASLNVLAIPVVYAWTNRVIKKKVLQSIQMRKFDRYVQDTSTWSNPANIYRLSLELSYCLDMASMVWLFEHGMENSNISKKQV